MYIYVYLYSSQLLTAVCCESPMYIIYIYIHIYTNFECLLYKCRIYINNLRRQFFLNESYFEPYESSADYYKQKM